MVGRRPLGNGIPHLCNDDREQHPGKMLDREESKRAVFHSSRKVSQGCAHDRTNGVKDKAENELNVQQRRKDQPCHLIFAGPLRSSDQTAPNSHQSPETGDEDHPAQQAMSVSEKEIRHRRGPTYTAIVLTSLPQLQTFNLPAPANNRAARRGSS